ncbi:recombinase family protein [Rhodococcus marinonascens]|uniref:recombinase family protein n=1 Tax=Rhodococcus marinonascens TaxID=38311 RepID=UPI0009338949|nr:recombinase family protein [Rhodococcus marinonascens]
MLFGYARVSTPDQNPKSQVEALRRAGVDTERIHLDHAGGAKASRPQLDLVLTLLRGGDSLVITHLDRLARSTAHLIGLGADLHERRVGLRVLEQGIDTATAEGAAMIGMLSVLADLHHELAVANTREGRDAARARGRKGGRPAKLTGEQIQLAQHLYDGGEHTVAEIADRLNVPRTTVYGHLNKQPRTSPGTPARPGGDRPTAARSPRACPTCGYEPTTRAEAAHQRADLAVTWLHPDPGHPDTVLERHHCRQCEPDQPAFDIACTVCGDGPILAGTLAEQADAGTLPAPVQHWLAADGWHTNPVLLCPDHTAQQ